MHSSVLDFAKRNLGLSTDPKLYFRSVTLPRLHNSPQAIPLTDSQYWSDYSNLFDFPSDVPTLISLSELRKAIQLRPENISNLVKFLVYKLDNLVHSDSVRHLLADAHRDHPSSPSRNPSFTDQLKGLSQGVPSTLLNSAADIVGVGASHHKLPKGPRREILNCVRVLTRVLPLLLEYASTIDQLTLQTPTTTPSSSKATSHQLDWILHLLWDSYPDLPTKDEELNDYQTTPTQPQFVIDEDEDDPDSTQTQKLLKNNTKSSNTNTSSNQPPPTALTRPPLMITLINTTLDLLFLPGVCVPGLSSSLNPSNRYPIWTAGIGCSQVPIDHAPSHNSNKVEVLRLLLAVLSKPLYSPPHLSCSPSSIQDILGLNEQDQSGQLFWKILQSPNPALAYITTQIPKQQLLGLLCSLINTSLAPAGTAFSSPSNAVSSLANGFGRITQSTKTSNLPTPPPLSSATSSYSVDSTSNVSRRPSVISNNGNSNSAPTYGGASTTGISQNLPEWCAVVLSLFLLPDPAGLDPSHHAPPSSAISETGPQNYPEKLMEETKSDHNNYFRIYLSKVHRPSDLSFLIDNILIILMKPMTVTSQLLTSDSVIGSNSLLTNSFLNYGCGLTEAILILYLSLECNPRLMSHLISTQKLSSIIIGLTFICLEQKDHPKPKIGLVKLCAITLQLLTANERKESSYIFNSKVELPVAIRAQYSVPGTLADFLIVSICSFIFSTSQVHNSHHHPQQKIDPQQEINMNNSDTSINLNSIYTPLILTITNLSPYLKEISKSSSARLTQLFTFFSNPINILSDQNNSKLVLHTLEIFNNIIHFQIQDNPYLIYSLIKIQKRINFLATFTLKIGLAEIQKAQNDRRGSTISINKKLDSPDFNNRHRSIEERFDEQGEDNEFGSLKKVDKGKGKMKEIQRNESSSSIATQQTLSSDPDQERGGRGRVEPNLNRSTSSDQFLVINSSSSTRKSSTSLTSVDPTGHPISGSDWTELDNNNLKSDVNPFILSNPNSNPLHSTTTTLTVNTIGRGRFVPTEAWVASWRDSLPLDTIQIMLAELKPKVTTMKKREEGRIKKKTTGSSSNNEVEEEREVINLLRSATLIGMIPKPKKKSKRSRTFELITTTPNTKDNTNGSGSVNNSMGLNWMVSFIWSIIFIKDSNSNRGNFFTGSTTSNTGTGTASVANAEVNGLKINLFGLTFLPTKRSSVKDFFFKNFSSSNSHLNPTSVNPSTNHPPSL